MALTPAIPGFADGEVISTAKLNALSATAQNLYDRKLGGFRTSKPLCVMYRSRNPGAPDNARDIVQAWDTIYANTDGIWSGGDQGAFTIWTPGYYRLSLQIHYDANPAGIRACKLMVNGTNPGVNAVAADCRVPNGDAEGTVLFCSTVAPLNAKDVVYGNVWQNSGQTVNIITTFSGSFMSAEWLAPL